jgi:hypothetical protein
MREGEEETRAEAGEEKEAKEELAGAIQYYEDITPGLGIRLKRQVKEVLSWIKLNSELPRLRTKGYRRVNCKTFP